jgi:hypothetical protein
VSTADWIALGGAIGSIAAAGATLALVLVGRKTLRSQLAQIEEQTRISNEQALVGYLSEYTKRYQEIVINLPEEINEPTFDMANHPDRKATMRFMRAYIDLCYEEWFLHNGNYLGEELWGIWSDGIATAMSKTAFRDAWDVIKADSKYDHAFTSFLSQLAAVEAGVR